MNTYGLNQEQWDILDKILITPLKAKGCTLWVFGSRARGDHHPYSDIDILYKTINEEALPNYIGNINEELENSNLPIKVDLVNLNNLAASYKESVFKDRIQL